MDTSFLSAVLTLNGKKNCGTNLTKVSRIMNACSGLTKDGMAQKSLFSLLGELNPQYRPALTVFDKIKPCSQAAPIPMSNTTKDGAAAHSACSSFAQFCASSNNTCPNGKNSQAASAACSSGENNQAAPAAYSSRNNVQTAPASCPSNKNSQSPSANIAPPTEIYKNNAPVSDYEPFVQYNNQSAHNVSPLRENRQAASAACSSRNNGRAAYTACQSDKNRKVANAPIAPPAEKRANTALVSDYEPFVQYNNETLKRR